jgi:hypothetical protein
MRRAALLLATGVLLSGGLLALAATKDMNRAPDGRRPHWNGMHVSLQVLVDGRPLSTIRHGGRTYLPVPRWGTEYTIRVWNHGPRRITAIVSVDGLSVINGQPATESHPGYIVDPRSSIPIQGWRRSMDTVAAFSFEERSRSYAHRIGRPDNIGVIGLVAFEEMSWRQPSVLEQKGSRATSARRASGTVGQTGTGYGRDVNSPIYYVPFVRSANKRTITLYYDTVGALREAGVPVDRPLPKPFPRDNGFVPPPPNERGK